MILGYGIQKVKDRDVVDVKDLKLSKMCLNCLSDNPPFKTALYKGKQWDYLCILENSIYLELVNIKTETLYLNTRLKEVVLKDIQSNQQSDEEKTEAPLDIQKAEDVKVIKDLESLNPEPAAKDKAEIL